MNCGIMDQFAVGMGEKDIYISDPLSPNLFKNDSFNSLMLI